MAKMIRIKNCYSCRYCKPKVEDGKIYNECVLIDKLIEDGRVIHPGCPLPDTQEEAKLKEHTLFRKDWPI